MAMTASGFVGLPYNDNDDRTVPERRFAVDEPLIPGRRPPTHHADRLEFVDHLGDAHEGRHRTERQPPEVDVGAGENDAYPPVGEAVRQIDDAIVEELCLVDGDDFCGVAEAARDLFG